MNLKEARVRCEKGQFLVVYLPNSKSKVVASCPECSDEMPIQPLPGNMERLQEDGQKLVAYHGFHCNNCDNGPWWFTDGVEIDPNIVQIKVPEYADDEQQNDEERADSSD